VILFSDILTPLPGMGVEFTIEEKTGPKIKPIRTWDQVRGPRVVQPTTGRLMPLAVCWYRVHKSQSILQGGDTDLETAILMKRDP
jgi:hypothetical protein